MEASLSPDHTPPMFPCRQGVSASRAVGNESCSVRVPSGCHRVLCPTDSVSITPSSFDDHPHRQRGTRDEGDGVGRATLPDKWGAYANTAGQVSHEVHELQRAK